MVVPVALTVNRLRLSKQLHYVFREECALSEVRCVLTKYSSVRGSSPRYEQISSAVPVAVQGIPSLQPVPVPQSFVCVTKQVYLCPLVSLSYTKYRFTAEAGAKADDLPKVCVFAEQPLLLCLGQIISLPCRPRCCAGHSDLRNCSGAFAFSSEYGCGVVRARVVGERTG